MARNYAALPHEYLTEMRALSDAAFGRLCRALLQYSMTGEEVRLTGHERLLLERVYAQERRYQVSYEEKVEKCRAAGRKSAAARKQAAGVDEPTADVSQTETETQNKTETKSLSSDDDDENTARADAVVAVVMSAYREKINPHLSRHVREMLTGFVETMGPECCLRAFDEALDAKSPKWQYIRGILQNKQAQGVRSLAEWDALEAKRGGKKQLPDEPWHYDPGSLEGSL